MTQTDVGCALSDTEVQLLCYLLSWVSEGQFLPKTDFLHRLHEPIVSVPVVRINIVSQRARKYKRVVVDHHDDIL